MMPLLRFTLNLAILGGLIYGLSVSFQIKDKSLPPVGSFLNPFSGFWQNAEPITGPSLQPAGKIKGLATQAEVVYDDLLIPHIFAGSIEDAARVQGYVTAQHRLFQMDVTVRKASGRLSEVLGNSTLALDKETRRRGLPWAAERDLEVWQKDPQTMAIVNAYTEGVNAWIEQLQPADYPIEYKLLDFKPEPWSTLKCVLVYEAMADMLANYNRDEEASNTLRVLGRADYDFLFPDWNPRQRPIVEGTYKAAASKAAASPAEKGDLGMLLPAQPDMPGTPFADNYKWYPDPPINGSNNWAVAGKLSANGHPMLANDPHLSLTLPSIWFQVQLHTPEMNCYGATLPGLPVVIIGFNENLAWGVTNVGSDVSDWYKIDWADATRSQYLLDGNAVPATLRIEQIWIKGQKQSLPDTVRYTQWGPVVHENPAHGLYNCAYRWVTHDPALRSVVQQFAQMNRAVNQQDYEQAITGFDVPAQNVVMADRQGEIGIRVQGIHLVRTGEDGRFIRNGNTRAAAWPDYLPQSDIPKMLNPDRGFVFSSNQNSVHVSDPRFAKYGDWDQYRGRHSYQRLSTLKGATVDSMMSMQNDNFSQRAADALPLLLRLLDRKDLDPVAQGMVAELEKWDYRYEKDKIAPSLFEMWLDSTYLETWDEFSVWSQKKVKLMYPEMWHFLSLLERDTTNRFFDHKASPEVETARQIVNKAFKKMYRQAVIETAKGKIVYGKFKGFHIPHITRKLPAFGRYDVEIGGHRSALNAIQENHGPSWRMIVELGETVKGYGVYPGGQSGNPGSRFYDNMVNTWAEGRYNELLLLGNSDPATAGKRLLAKQVFTN